MKKAKPVKRVKKVVLPDTCGNCYFWRNETCMRFPPSKIPGDQLAVHRVMTHKSDWCGEWLKRA